MNAYGQAEFGEEIVRRVLIEASIREQRREEAQDRRDVLESLLEITGLTRAELEEIMIKVKGSCDRDRDTFLSIKQQLIGMSAMLAFVFCVPAFFIWM